MAVVSEWSTIVYQQ